MTLILIIVKFITPRTELGHWEVFIWWQRPETRPDTIIPFGSGVNHSCLGDHRVDLPLILFAVVSDHPPISRSLLLLLSLDLLLQKSL